MQYEIFSTFYFAIIAFWLIIVIFQFINTPISKRLTPYALLISLILQLALIISLWLSIDRPPFRTLAETRLWYAFFLSSIGLVLYLRWQIFWIVWYCMAIAAFFLTLDFFKPETFDTTLIPALQSIWFIPHVVTYIIAYAMLSAAALIAFNGLYLIYRKKTLTSHQKNTKILTQIGFAFLTFGLIFGAIWAKEAWGHYWSWDPKETWALTTWLLYLTYLHIQNHIQNSKIIFWILIVGFFVIILCWFGIKYLPTGQDSIHVFYNN